MPFAAAAEMWPERALSVGGLQFAKQVSMVAEASIVVRDIFPV